MSEQQGYELGWDSAIEHDSEGFELLPEGDYNFRVIKFERGRHEGSDKLPPCNKATLTLEVSDGVHRGTLQHNLFLHSRTEGLLCAFFTAIGQRKHGERLNPRWDQVIGATGTCQVEIRTWRGRDGDTKQSNSIKRFYERPDTPDTPVATSVPFSTGFTPGKF